MSDIKELPESQPPAPDDDKLKCAFCGTVTEGFNEFLECPKCNAEGPGCWTQDFHKTLKSNQIN